MLFFFNRVTSKRKREDRKVRRELLVVSPRFDDFVEHVDEWETLFPAGSSCVVIASMAPLPSCSRKACRLRRRTWRPSLSSPEASTPSQQRLPSVTQRARPPLHKNRAKFKTSLGFFSEREMTPLDSSLHFAPPPLFPLLMFLFYLHVQKPRLPNQIETILVGQQRVRQGDEHSEMNIWPVVPTVSQPRTFLRGVEPGGADMNRSGEGRLGGKEKKKKKLYWEETKGFIFLKSEFPRGLFDLSLQYVWKRLLSFHENVRRFET